MSFKPLQVPHPAQPYAALAARLPQGALAQQVPPLLAQVYDWLTAQKLAVTGAPLIRYLEVQPHNGQLQVHVGFPISELLLGAQAPYIVDSLPAGTYVTVVHRGPYDGLATTTSMLLDWGTEHGVAWAKSDATHWQARVEHYLVGPPAESRSAHWHTEVAILRA